MEIKMITITFPDTPNVLRALAVDFLDEAERRDPENDSQLGLPFGVTAAGTVVTKEAPTFPENIEPTPVVQPLTTGEGVAPLTVGTSTVAAPNPFAANPVVDPTAATNAMAIVEEPLLKNEPDNFPATAPDNVPPPAVTPAVELDGEGLPWDPRIHTPARTKVKSTDGWKKKRGVDKELVVTVEAKLRTAMAGAPVTPVVPTPAAPAELTLVGLMQKITGAGMDHVAVQAALTKHGAPPLQVLGKTRPDLIQVIHDELFPAGSA